MAAQAHALPSSRDSQAEPRTSASWCQSCARCERPTTTPYSINFTVSLTPPYVVSVRVGAPALDLGSVRCAPMFTISISFPTTRLSTRTREESYLLTHAGPGAGRWEGGGVQTSGRYNLRSFYIVVTTNQGRSSARTAQKPRGTHTRAPPKTCTLFRTAFRHLSLRLGGGLNHEEGRIVRGDCLGDEGALEIA